MLVTVFQIFLSYLAFIGELREVDFQEYSFPFATFWLLR